MLFSQYGTILIQQVTGIHTLLTQLVNTVILTIHTCTVIMPYLPIIPLFYLQPTLAFKLLFLTAYSQNWHTYQISFTFSN